LKLLAKTGTMVNHGECPNRFRKPSLYPAELRDRRPTAGQQALAKLHSRAIA
jgi:hypothetical protein